MKCKALAALLTALGFPVVIFAAAYLLPTQDYSETAIATITEMELLENVRVLAHKTMGGRGTLNNGCELPAFFLERELREYGFEPFGDMNDNGDYRFYFQKLLAVTVDSKGNAVRVVSQNVIGCIEGEKKDELVIIGAHYDHVGFGEYSRREGKFGEVFCGADDNGSGTAAALEVAEALGELKKKGVKPKRSIVIAFWGAEELGLVGSNHFLSHPPRGVEIKNIVAYINMDMVGRNDPGEVSVYCSPVGKKDECAELYEIADKTNQRLSLGFKILHDDNCFGFTRTDGWSFYTARDEDPIPVWELFTGEHPDYHTPRDTWEKLDYSKLTRVAKLAFGIAWHVAQMDRKPRYR